ncbi:hypothetical protein NDU88_008114 [Pleurodeles waltl]|uniref:Uncharacterized protein n=1 Tax=Pleurodeles waltl TaxID=8319 RepID=A0AAV7SU77_PLEWA|nr:hypothetical protein NDU88_008114 [Pleurodeles waltl]
MEDRRQPEPGTTNQNPSRRRSWKKKRQNKAPHGQAGKGQGKGRKITKPDDVEVLGVPGGPDHPDSPAGNKPVAVMIATTEAPEEEATWTGVPEVATEILIEDAEEEKRDARTRMQLNPTVEQLRALTPSSGFSPRH